MLGKAADTAATARALVDAGRAIDAVRLVRETEEVSLTDAKRRVDALRSREPSS